MLNATNIKFITNHSKIIHRNLFKISKIKKNANFTNFSSNGNERNERKKNSKNDFFEKIAFYQTIAILKTEINIDKINTTKIVIKIKIKIANMTENVIKINIKIEINIVKKFMTMNDSILNFRMLNFRKRILIVMNMKISMQITSYIKK